MDGYPSHPLIHFSIWISNVAIIDRTLLFFLINFLNCKVSPIFWGYNSVLHYEVLSQFKILKFII